MRRLQHFTFVWVASERLWSPQKDNGGKTCTNTVKQLDPKMAENIWFFSLFFVTPKCCTSRTFSWEHSENIFRFFPFFSLFFPFFPLFPLFFWEQLRTIENNFLRTIENKNASFWSENVLRFSQVLSGKFFRKSDDSGN